MTLALWVIWHDGIAAATNQQHSRLESPHMARGEAASSFSRADRWPQPHLHSRDVTAALRRSENRADWCKARACRASRRPELIATAMGYKNQGLAASKKNDKESV